MHAYEHGLIADERVSFSQHGVFVCLFSSCGLRVLAAAWPCPVPQLGLVEGRASPTSPDVLCES